MKKILTILIAIFTLLIMFPKPALAANLNIVCSGSPSGCSQTGDNPLFSKTLDGYWYPGRELTKTINLKNTGSDTRQMALKATQTSISDDLKQVMSVSITDTTSTIIWSGSLPDFYNQTGIVMGTFSQGTNKDYYFKVTMDSSANNDYQGLETKFDLTLGFWGDVISPPPSVRGQVAGASTGGGGGAASPPVCNDTKPAGVPTLLQAIAGVNSVKLVWSEGTGPISYYLVAFGLTPGAITYGSSSIGGAGTTNYTVTNLSGGTPYYFRVRSGNGCAPGDYSNEIATTPTGTVLALVPAGFAPGVLGTATKSGAVLGKQAPVKQVLGRQTNLYCSTCLWWQIILGEIIVLLIYYWLVFYKKAGQRFVKRKFVWALVIPIIAYIIFLILNKGCLINYFFVSSKNFFCQWFWLIDSGVYGIIAYYIYRKRKKKQNS